MFSTNTVYIGVIGILITISAFSTAYVITTWRQSRPYRKPSATPRTCAACGKADLTVIHLVVADGQLNQLLCMTQDTLQVEALWGLRCAACGHVMLYSEPVYPHGHPRTSGRSFTGT